MRILLGVLFFFTAVSLCAQTHKAVLPKLATHFAKLEKATSQRVLPGRKETPPGTQYSLIIKWVGTLTPEDVYWYNDGRWQKCTLSGLEKGPSSLQEKVMIPEGETLYCCNAIEAIQIKKGSYIELMPVDGAVTKVPQPANLGQKAIYFTIKNKWYYLPVNSIVSKPDIVLP